MARQKSKQQMAKKAASQEAFLAATAEGLSRFDAAARAGVERSITYEWQNNEPEFAKRYELAEKMGCDAIRAEIQRRAIAGVEEPVFYKGAVCGHITRYSDRLLERLAQARMPEEYGTHRHELTGKNGAPLVPTLNLNFDPSPRSGAATEADKGDTD